jgi:flagellar motor protein MotB
MVSEIEGGVMRIRSLNESETDVWPAFTDFLTSVLFIVVLFIFGIMVSSIARSRNEIEVVQRQQRRVRTELETRLSGKLEIPPEDGNLQRIILRVDEQGGGGVLFDRGSAMLREEGKQLLNQIVTVLEDNRDEYDTIQVEGHTDDTPIHPSNWQLSAARAGAVVSYILSEAPSGKKLEPWRFSANGRGEFRPYSMKEENMNLDPAANPRRGPELKYVVEANQTSGINPTQDNPLAQRNRRIEIILTYKVNAGSGNKQ